MINHKLIAFELKKVILSNVYNQWTHMGGRGSILFHNNQIGAEGIVSMGNVIERGVVWNAK